jgi:hypothetical protein
VIGLTFVLVLALASLALAVFLLGFRLGGDHWQAELARVRLEAAQAQGRIHDLTLHAFVAMAEHVQAKRSGRSVPPPPGS